jgi:DNA polymerase
MEWDGTLWADTETYCEKPIKHGTYTYAENCEVMLFAYALNQEPVKCWDLTTGAPMPSDLERALKNPKIRLVFHNAMFDRAVLNNSTNLRVKTDVKRWYDVMVKAMMHGLPGALEKLCHILRVEQDIRKQKIGNSLIKLLCVPRPANQKIRRATRHTHPVEWEQFKEYAIIDVAAMRAVESKIPNWNYHGEELALWHLDQQINDRGMCVDVDFANSALEAVAKAKDILGARTKELTDNELESTTQRDKLLKYIVESYGVELPDMKAATLETRIWDEELPETLRELLKIRLAATTTSTSKYKSLINGVSRDGRLRGTLQFCGANRTGRWAGRVFQPQNLPRLDREAAARWYGKEKVSDEEAAHYVTAAIEAIQSGTIDLFYDEVMPAASSAIRGCIIAPKGKKLVISDYANIEGRVIAWFAGEDWKLQAFSDYDNDTGPDLYNVSYARSFAVDIETITKDQRQLGKVQELALGYEGGVGAFVTMVMTYKMDLVKLSKAALPNIPEDVLAEAARAWKWAEARKQTLGLERDVYIACDSLKRLWRRAHPKIVQFWKDLQDAVIYAIMNPGRTRKVGLIEITKMGSWLRVKLPKGRSLCYPGIQLGEDNKISYMGQNQYTKRWQRLYTYGGKLAENFTQAGARDVIAARMPFVENCGYKIILTSHDEVVSEAPDSKEFNSEALGNVLTINPVWAKGLPLAASGYETYRYRKE